MVAVLDVEARLIEVLSNACATSMDLPARCESHMPLPADFGRVGATSAFLNVYADEARAEAYLMAAETDNELDAVIEFVVASGHETQRDMAFRRGLVAIGEALRTSLVDGEIIDDFTVPSVDFLSPGDPPLERARAALIKLTVTFRGGPDLLAGRPA